MAVERDSWDTEAGTDCLEINSYEDVGNVLRSPAFTVAGGRPASERFAAGSLLFIDGVEHRRRRAIYQGIFRGQVLLRIQREDFSQIIEGALDELAATHGAGPVETDLVPLHNRIFWQLAARVVGLDDVHTTQAATFLEEKLDHIARGLVVHSAPAAQRAAILARAAAAKQDFWDLIQPSHERRKKFIQADGVDESSRPRDLISLLITNSQEEWDEDRLLREIVLILSAATQNNASTLNSCIVMLEYWCHDHPDDDVRKRDSEFLLGALWEALRLHYTLGLLQFRRAMQDVELPSGTHVAADQIVGVNLATANRDVGIFGDDADEFDPHRHRRVAPPHRPYGLAFGAGPHKCIGQPMVLEDHRDDRTGVLLQDLLRLYAAGIELVEGHPPVRAESHPDRYVILPVRFTNLSGSR